VWSWQTGSGCTIICVAGAYFLTPPSPRGIMNLSERSLKFESVGGRWLGRGMEGRKDNPVVIGRERPGRRLP